MKILKIALALSAITCLAMVRSGCPQGGMFDETNAHLWR